MPEPGNRPFVRFLDKVYTTGEPHVGTEYRAELYKEDSDSIEESYFDFIFHPLRDMEGLIYGVLCLASDVTDRVLSKLVSESRESQLYRQWCELSTIYNKSPLGLCLFDPQSLSVNRINDEFSTFIGVDCQSASGQSMSDLFARTPKMKTLLQWAADGQSIDNYELTVLDNGENRIWRLNINPIVDSFGKVEGILASALNVEQ